ncbi:MAG: M23 family metallopeptidase [Spirochaetota bacterium]
MSLVRDFKNFETRQVNKLFHTVEIVQAIVKKGVLNIRRNLRTTITLMVIPPTGKETIRLRVSWGLFLFLGFIILLAIIGCFYMVFHGKEQASYYEAAEKKLSAARASLERLEDEMSNVRYLAYRFKDMVHNLKNEKSYVTSFIDQTSINTEDFDSSINNQLSMIKSLSASLESSNGDLDKVADSFRKIRDFLKDLPSMWPVKNGLGRITFQFGPNLHPIYKSWYLHKGTDFGYRKGVPLVAAGNGVVASVTYEPLNYGNCIILKHKYGYYTRYAHLGSVAVKTGDTVTQGQVIGTMGDTGLIDAPHLHFEVLIGSQVIDPESLLLKINNNDLLAD